MFALRPLILFALLFGLGGQAVAASCAYREAIMALQQGNQLRGMALLRMASRDGDPRASRYLASLQVDADKQPAVSLTVLASSTQ